MKNSGLVLAWSAFGLAMGLILATGCGGSGGGVLTTGGNNGGTNGRGCTADDYQPNYVTEMEDASSNRRLRYWDGFPLRLFIDRSGFWTSEREAAALRGFQSWEEAFPGGVTFEFVNSASNADIKVEFVDQATLGQNTVGLTTSQFEVPSGRNIDCDMQLAVNSPFANTEFTLEDIQSTAVHEMGHALGIAGHSPDEGDVMYFANTREELTINDINTLKTAYCNQFSTRSRSEGKRVPTGPTATETIRCGATCEHNS